MPWIVGEGVEDYEIMLATKKDEIRLIVILSGFLAQDAALFWGPLYIFYAPGRPQIFHQIYIVC